jgi:hypothetical protein
MKDIELVEGIRIDNTRVIKKKQLVLNVNDEEISEI